MIISEFGKPVTAKSLNESLANRYGKKLNLEKFTLEQLQDARNKLRTQLFNVETMESFDSVQNDAYAKSKLMLDVLNAEISERGDIEEEALEEKAKPDYIDIDGDGDKKEPMKKAVKDKEKKKTDESVIAEGAEDHAELVMAAKDMVDRLTGWMEDTAEMQSESMLELADAIRDEMGQQQADAFVNTVKPALEQLYAAMEGTRTSLTTGVGMLTGEGEAPAPDMGAADAEAEAAQGVELDTADMEPTVDQDEFGAAAAAAGGTDEAGRARRESRMYKKKAMLEQSRRLGVLLSKKK